MRAEALNHCQVKVEVVLKILIIACVDRQAAQTSLLQAFSGLENVIGGKRDVLNSGARALFKEVVGEGLAVNGAVQVKPDFACRTG